ncbi:methyltransferase domain-containing protein [Apiospora aurea]|uniref:Methyltransferase domain-containing protein n=1 Tax=Apiospora aurea TaxID=335848 RepID=A0ABR1QPK1_9PEZI
MGLIELYRLQAVSNGSAEPEAEIGATDDLHLFPDVESDDSDIEDSYYAKKERRAPDNASVSPPKLLSNFRSKLRKLQTFIQHQLSIEVHAGRLYLAPVTTPKRVLDVGTGSGEWALDFARENPASSVLGVDLEAVTIPITVPNCNFCVGDVEEEWQFSSGAFDYIYARSLARKFADTRRYLASVYANLNPGGFAEFQEWITELRCPNYSLEGTAIQKWNRGMLQGSASPAFILLRNVPFWRPHADKTTKPAFKQIGQELDFINGYPSKLADAGFRIGTLMRQNTAVVLEMYSETVFVGILGWSKEDLQTLMRDVREDLINNNIHCYAVL